MGKKSQSIDKIKTYFMHLNEEECEKKTGIVLFLKVKI